MKLGQIILSLVLGFTNPVSSETNQSIDKEVFDEFKQYYSRDIPEFLVPLRENNLENFYDSWKEQNSNLYNQGLDAVLSTLREELPAEHWGTITYNGELPEQGWDVIVKDSLDFLLGQMNGGIIINGTEAWYNVIVASDDPFTIEVDEGAENGETTFPLINNVPANQTLTHNIGTNERTDLSITTTSTNPDNNSIPDKYFLSQNYPNPFNSSTNIEFGITEPSNVNLTIYNLRGEEIAKLVDKELIPGEYKINWQAQNQPSNIYICRLKTNEHSLTKKLTLIK
jgi:hypothetical protein